MYTFDIGKWNRILRRKMVYQKITLERKKLILNFQAKTILLTIEIFDPQSFRGTGVTGVENNSRIILASGRVKFNKRNIKVIVGRVDKQILGRGPARRQYN